LYNSIQGRLYTLPDETRVFVGHDYLPEGRELRYETTIGRSKRENPHLRPETALEEFVSLRQTRDRQLDPPRLLYPSVQFNVNGGRFFAPGRSGVRYFKIPVNLRRPTNEVGEPDQRHN
jgi:hypothetical protein